MKIIKIYDTRKVTKRLIGYVTVTDNDFNRLPVEGRPEKVALVPNGHLYNKVKKDLGRDWSDNFGWKMLSIGEVKELIESYNRKAKFYEGQSNRLITLMNL